MNPRPNIKRVLPIVWKICWKFEYPPQQPQGHGQQLLSSPSKLPMKGYGAEMWSVTLGQGHDIHLDHGKPLCDTLSKSNMAVRSCGLDMDLGDVWPWQYDLGSRSWHTHDHGRLCEIFRSDMAVRSYGSDIDLVVCTDLDLGDDLDPTSYGQTLARSDKGKELWPRHDVNRRCNSCITEWWGHKLLTKPYTKGHIIISLLTLLQGDFGCFFF